jgi:hypothetical protein
MDWGYSNYTVGLWFVTGKVKPSAFAHFFGCYSPREVDVVIVYREYVKNFKAETEVAMDIVNATPLDERKEISNLFLDPQCFAKKGASDTPADLMQGVFNRHNMPGPREATNERILGWRSLYNGLHQTSSLLSFADQEITEEHLKRGPLLFISSECTELISIIPILVRDPDEKEDILDSKRVDADISDAWRYGFHSYLHPRQTPLAVQRREVYDTAENPNDLAMKMRLFDVKAKQIQYIRNPRRRIR